MSGKFLATLLLSSLWSATSMAQGAPPAYAPAPYAPPPGYAPAPYAPPPGYYAPQPYPPQAYAPPPMVGYHEHDGFYLRLLLGPGYFHNSASYNGVTITESGVGATFGMAAGGVVAPNLVVYGELLGTSVTDPHYDDGSTSGSYSGVNETLVGFGPGIAYYLQGNMYVSGTLLFSKITYSDSNNSDNSVDGTDLGVGLGLTFGKEWWVSYDWGLGVSGQLLAASMKDANFDTRWTTIVASLLFSATYN